MSNPTHEVCVPGRRPTARGQFPGWRPALGWALAAVLAAARAATAGTWTEVGDAGQLPSTAQVTLGLPNSLLTAISGTISTTSDHDMFEIYIPVGSAFSATTVGQPGTIFDTQLFLFDSTGRGVYANDDDAAGAGASLFRSTLPAGSPLGPVTTGYYFLLIDVSGSYPTSSGGVIFPNFSTNPANETAVVGPTGPGGGSTITGYSGTGAETGTYTIALAGAMTAVIVPHPGGLVLLLTGSPCLLTFALVRRVRARSGCVGARG
jgi:hypothetical protein